MEGTQPTPSLDGIELAAKTLVGSMPPGLQLDGVAYVDDGTPQWSASYRVVGDFFAPEASNILPARSSFQSSAPCSYRVKRVAALVISIGGLLVSKWQVTYGVGA